MTYNGWTNFATWKINLEVIGDIPLEEYFDTKPDQYDLEDWIRSYIKDILDSSDADDIVRNWAESFISDVNYSELARTYLIDWEDDEDEF